MKVKSKTTVIIEFIENIPEESIEELERNIEFRLNSKEHREVVEFRLTEILKDELGSEVEVEDVTVIDLESKQI